MSSVTREHRTPDDDRRLTVLALAAREGRPADIEAFARAIYPDVQRFTTYLTDPQAAEDLTQETLVRVLGSLPRFAGRSSARTWLLSIVRRVVVDRFRTAAVRPVIADVPDWQLAAERRQLRDLPGAEDGVALADLLDKVPPDRRQAFVLTQLAGLPYAEAADLIGCPIGTVRSRVARARAQLMASLLEADAAGGTRATVAPSCRAARCLGLPLS
ncbi:RNA polymerase subunit sigma [Sphaerisporangium album]|uniref:RNA polymerase sigma factor n=1 Tax=Sphaerisporangium album TaxID=509200 RepID=A0A367F9J2_9ACTN|nr:sigma-70 family RNA polymerase sigma factor [Sphaerisporangium album]RCG27038.1 RNA polymerase subunit sigma [Sphaerisporangium album]